MFLQIQMSDFNIWCRLYIYIYIYMEDPYILYIYIFQFDIFMEYGSFLLFPRQPITRAIAWNEQKN